MSSSPKRGIFINYHWSIRMKVPKLAQQLSSMTMNTKRLQRIFVILVSSLTIVSVHSCHPHTNKSYSSKKDSNEISPKNTIGYLASEELEGRATGSEGERKAAAYIIKKFERLGLSPKGTEGFLQSFSYVPHGAAQIHHNGDSTSMGMALVKEVKTANVVAFKDNKSANTIVIGAHYDHLGYGDENSLWTGEKAIHNGADDNASGVAALLELAEYLSKSPAGTTNNNYLFIAFSGEEKGLYGSNHFTKNPTMPISQFNYMLNMDMVGRLNAEKALAINGVGTSSSWMPALSEIKTNGIKQITSESGVGPSDHTSFYLSDIPVLHFFTGQHEDYHKPTDDADKINYPGIDDVVELMTNLIVKLNEKGKLDFVKTKDATPAAADFKVTLGVIPDYLYSGKGLRIDGAKEGRPGAKAGLIKGDTIIELGDFPIEDIYGYMDALGKFEKGQIVKCVVLRGEEKVTLTVVFE